MALVTFAFIEPMPEAPASARASGASAIEWIGADSLESVPPLVDAISATKIFTPLLLPEPAPGLPIPEVRRIAPPSGSGTLIQRPSDPLIRPG